jgi:hypothetical protein
MPLTAGLKNVAAGWGSQTHKFVDGESIRRPLARPSATLSPSDGGEGRGEGLSVFRPIFFGGWYDNGGCGGNCR